MSRRGLPPKTYVPLPMTPREMRELILDGFESDADLMKGEYGLSIAHLVAHEATPIKGYVSGVLDVALDCGSGVRHVVYVDVLTEDAMISLFVPPTAKRPRIEFPYEVDSDDNYLCPDVLRNRDLVKELARSKCIGLFTGLESLDPEFLKKHDKRQNIAYANSLLDDVAFAQRQGIVVMYGYLFDPRMTTTTEMARQIEAVLAAETLSFPSFFSFVAPLLGTKLFWESVELGELRPGMRLRDLDGQSVAYRNCRSSDDELSAFGDAIFQRLDRIAGPMSLLRRSLKTIFATGWPHPIFWLLTFVNNQRAGLRRAPALGVIRTYIAGTDGLNPQYGCIPSDVSQEDKRRFFDPIMVTDQNGDLAEWLEPYRPSRATAAAGVGV